MIESPRANRWLLTVLLTAGAAGAARAVFVAHDKIASQWATAPLSMDGGQEQWAKGAATPEPGASFRAMNDSSDLYLLITPRGRHGRGLLSGGYRQDAGVWFLGPDQTTREWGLRFPYSRRPDDADSGAAQTPSLEPEYVVMRDLEISTAPMPAGVAFRLVLDERKAQVELKIALKNLPGPFAEIIPLEFTTTPVPPEIAVQIRNEKPAAGVHGGGRRGGRHHGGGAPPSAGPPPDDDRAADPLEIPDEVPGAPETAPTVPDALDLALNVTPARPPLEK